MGVGENLSKGSGDMWNYSFLRNGENLHQEKVVQDKWSKKDLKSRAWFFVEMPIPSKSSSPKEDPCEVQPWYFHFFVERVTNKRRLQVSNNVIGLFGKVSAQNLDKHSFQNKSAKVHWQKMVYWFLIRWQSIHQLGKAKVTFFEWHQQCWWSPD